MRESPSSATVSVSATLSSEHLFVPAFAAAVLHARCTVSGATTLCVEVRRYSPSQAREMPKGPPPPRRGQRPLWEPKRRRGRGRRAR
eukprot:4357304-Pyramimonas_sp.AAC.1